MALFHNIFAAVDQTSLLLSNLPFKKAYRVGDTQRKLQPVTRDIESWIA